MANPIVSIIIPQRNSTLTIPRLLDSIPICEDVEVLLVDNSPTPISKADINSNREYNLLWSPPERYAGGARNKGIENAKGEWLIFADADDFFTENAFEIFKKYFSSNSDVIYFSSKGIYSDGSGETNRADYYNALVREYLDNPTIEMSLRVDFSVPWAKMIRREFVISNSIWFDEVVAANDAYFSLLSGYYAKQISASREVVYIVTTSKGSLTKRKDKAALCSRYNVALKKNRFLKRNGLGKYQSSVMIYLVSSMNMGFCSFLKFMKQAILYRQNIFIGCSRWFRSYLNKRKMDVVESKYYTT